MHSRRGLAVRAIIAAAIVASERANPQVMQLGEWMGGVDAGGKYWRGLSKPQAISNFEIAIRRWPFVVIWR